MNQPKDSDKTLDERTVLKELLIQAQQEASHQRRPTLELTDEQSRQLALQIKKILRKHLN
ncbi:hypothetical protein GHNINEIG_01871 [Hydrogenovibrio crunogenus]|uniref:Uncharacterized protein n=1 Tax=Hydrogenovibrio crunogenus TaxID=39765 RepID=A0A4P7P1G1_9GAMM|nr:hypothetical protein [Hydrogenovibrio crunogenus]QBZ83809.1 hypothetical protein GHNINEIG_01871 [Hydrogenovibrio crunogenus]RUM91234.1 MAG: hypothetical protein DSZ27_07065 [Thiomicrospira sp.]